MAQDKKARPGPSRINVVGIGASAGGIEALREFFGALPDDLGLAYVVIVHLAPDHESELASILSRRTKMPVVEITEKSLELTRNSVYVIPPDRRLELRDGTIRATPFTDDAGRRSAIDFFFRSLAESLKAAIHVTITGENTHHMIEACFKGVGRALRQAFRREGDELPSTKGIL